MNAPRNPRAIANKKQWVSEGTQAREQHTALVNSMERLFRKSPFVPWELYDWLEHKAEMLVAEKEQTTHRLENKQHDQSRTPVLPAFGGRTFSDNRSSVLCQETIWCNNYHQKNDVAPWPTPQEMRWEGDDRANTGVGRFLPLPRQPAIPTVPWHNLRALDQYPLDQTWRVPSYEDVYHPVEEIPEEKIKDLLPSDLVEALDCNDIPFGIRSYTLGP